jgi:SSS family solute:Na+ symporter
MSGSWLGFLNPAIIAVYMAALIAMGLRFSHRQTTTDRYFVANRSIPGWAMGISLLATIITSVTFIAYPGAAYLGNWSLIVPGVMMLAVPATIGLAVVPFFRQIVRMSAFEYFGLRFGTGVRLYSSAMFVTGHFCKMAFVLYLLALTVNSITGWNTGAVLAVTTAVAVLYALTGGFEAIVWADVIQGGLLWVGVLLAIGFLLILTPASPSQIFDAAWQSHKFSFGSTALDLHHPTVLVLLLYGFFFYLQKYTADQTVVQRYLVARTDRQALRGILLGAVLCLPVWGLFMLAGTLLWGYYHFTHQALPTFITRGDQVFPYFLSSHLPPGVGGIFLAALFGAGMAMLASDLNCLATVLVRDFYHHHRPNATDRRSLRAGRLFVFLGGLAGMTGAWLLAHSHGAVLAIYYAVTSIVAGGLAGIFVLAFLSGRTGRRAVQAGIVANLIFTVWATLTSGAHPRMAAGRLAFPWHDYMIGVVGQVVVMAVGLAATPLLRRPAEAAEPMTLWRWLREKRTVAAASPTDLIARADTPAPTKASS